MSRKLILASSVAMVLAGTDASALGLGGLNTQSALNQPFRGQIELEDVQAAEIDSVSATIASQDAFDKIGIERYYYLTRLTFTPEVTPQGKAVIRVSSKDPIREPYMDFLVSVVWPTGQLVKGYAVLLDPPALSKQSAPAVRSASADSVASGSRSVAAQAAGIGRPGTYIAAPGEGFPIYAGPVANGMGLWALALDKAPADATAAQAAMALYRNNQNAFIRGDINRLIAGKTLVIPSRAELFALDAEAAQREYRAGLRGRAQYREPITDVASISSSRLQLSGTREAPGDSAGSLAAASAPAARQDLMLALETSESTRQEAVELRGRVKELESQLEDIQALLQLRNAELARMQGVEPVPGSLAEQPQVALETTQDVQPIESAAQPESVSEPDAMLDPAAESVAMLDEESTNIAGDEPASIDPSTVIELEDALESLDAALAEEETGTAPALIPVPVPTPVVIETTETEEVVEVAVVPADESAQAVAGGTPDSLETNSTWHSLLLPLAALAGVTALGIMAFSWITTRRRREEEALEDYEETGFYDTLDVATEPRSSLLTEDDSRADDQPLSESSSAHPRDTDGESESSLTTISSLSGFDAETDEADVLSEADIYIAYGRHGEAQELLKAELQRFPERQDVRFKLAESFAADKDLDALDGVMKELQSAGGAALEPALWAKLQSQREYLKTGAAAAPASEQAPIATRQDSLSLGSDDAFSLDISDVQQASEPTERSGSSGRLDLGLDLDRGGEPPVEASLPDSGFLRDSFGDAMTVATSDRADLAQRRQDEDTELEMTLEEHKVEDVDDLDSIFDSGMSEGSASTPQTDEASAPGDLPSSQWQQVDSEIWDETATKLDLARAYIEMDDKEAAREILEEVVVEGRDEQQAEAKALLETMA